MNLTDFIDLEDPKPELVLLPPDFLAAHTYWDEDVQRRPKPGLIRSIRKALETGSVDYNKIRPAELTYRKEKALGSLSRTDGNHRIEAAIKANSPLWCVVHKDRTLEEEIESFILNNRTAIVSTNDLVDKTAKLNDSLAVWFDFLDVAFPNWKHKQPAIPRLPWASILEVAMYKKPNNTRAKIEHLLPNINEDSMKVCGYFLYFLDECIPFDSKNWNDKTVKRDVKHFWTEGNMLIAAVYLCAHFYMKFGLDFKIHLKPYLSNASRLTEHYIDSHFSVYSGKRYSSYAAKVINDWNERYKSNPEMMIPQIPEYADKERFAVKIDGKFEMFCRAEEYPSKILSDIHDEIEEGKVSVDLAFSA